MRASVRARLSPGPPPQRGRTGLRASAVAAVAVAAAAAAPPAASQELQVDLDAPRRVVFHSSATLDDFQGVTDRIDGFALLDGNGVRATDEVPGSRLYFEVELASLDTGISLRNRHMRENYLETDRHPYAAFDGGIDRIEAGPDGRFRVTATGSFAVHGIVRDRTLACDAAPQGTAFRVTCRFPVRLEDHGIEIPRIMFMKLAPVVELELDFRLRPAPPAEEESRP